MTTIAYRDGVLAADTLLCGGDTRVGYWPKAFRIGRVLAASSGTTAYAQVFVDWVRSGMKEPRPPCHDGEKDGEGACGWVYHPSGYEVGFWPKTGPVVMRAPFYSHGSGGEIALGALQQGATAEEAVRAASKWDNNTGGEITVLRHDEPCSGYQNLRTLPPVLRFDRIRPAAPTFPRKAVGWGAP